MQKNQKNALGRLRRVHAFLEREKPTVAFGSIESTVTGLAEIIARLEAAAVEQESKTSTAMISTRYMHRLVVAVRKELMRPVIRMAQSFLPTDERLVSVLKLPRALDPERVASAALGLADAIEPHTRELTNAGFPADFVPKLRTAGWELKKSIDARAGDFARRVGSTKATRTAVSQGRRLVGVLDAMVAPALAGNPEKLTEWQALLRVVRPAATETVLEETRVPSAAPTVPASSVAPSSPSGVAQADDLTAPSRMSDAQKRKAA